MEQYDGSTSNWDGSEEQAREHYDFNPKMAEAFGSFENYMAYLQEAQAARAETVAANTQAFAEDPQAQEIADAGGLMQWYGSQVAAGNDPGAMEGSALASAQSSWDEVSKSLWEKYTTGSVSQDSYEDENGDKYHWNGTSFTRYEQGSDEGWDIATGLMQGVALGAIGGGIAGAAGLTGGAAGAAQGAIGATLGGAINGDIDPKSILISTAMGGLNPGGSVSNALGVNPNSFGGGFIGGSINSAVGDGLRTGEFDAGSILQAGLLQGGTNSLVNAWNAVNNNDIDSLMQQEAAKHKADYRAATGSYEGYVPLTQDQLYTIASQNPMLDKTNFGALIGEGGLLPFIPEMDVSGLSNFTDNVFGYTANTALFNGPDGQTLTAGEMLQAGQDPQAVWESTYFNGPDINGYSFQQNAPGSDPNSLFNQITEWAGNTELGQAVNTGLDIAASAQFKEKYGFFAEDNPALAAQVVAYGDLVENYTYADNPRGDSEMYGVTYDNGNYTQGLSTIFDSVTGLPSAITVPQSTVDATNEAGDAARDNVLNNNGAIINYGGDLSTLPGAGAGEAFWQEFLANFDNNSVDNSVSEEITDASVVDNVTEESVVDDTTEEVTNEVTNEVTEEVTNEVANNTQQLPSNPDYRRDQITQLLGGTMESIPQQLPSNSTESIPEQLPSNSDYRLNQIIDLLGSSASTPELGGNTQTTPEQLPPDSTTPLPGLDPVRNPNNGVNPEWGDLYKYKKLEKWKRARDRQYAGIAGLLQNEGSPMNSTKRKYTQRQKSDMGLLS